MTITPDLEAWKSAPVAPTLLVRVLDAFASRGLFLTEADAAHVARYLTCYPVRELDGVPGADAPAVEVANIRRLLERHGVRPCDGLGEVRSTVAMVEDALVSGPRR